MGLFLENTINVSHFTTSDIVYKYFVLIIPQINTSTNWKQRHRSIISATFCQDKQVIICTQNA